MIMNNYINLLLYFINLKKNIIFLEEEIITHKSAYFIQKLIIKQIYNES